MTTTAIEDWFDPNKQDEATLKQTLARCAVCGRPGPAMCSVCCSLAGITKPSIKVEPIKK
jgi:hypothetical protein